MTWYKPRKDQKKIKIKNRTFTADKGMITVLKELNKAGFKTVMHCVGKGGKYHSDMKFIMFDPNIVKVKFIGRFKCPVIILDPNKEKYDT